VSGSLEERGVSAANRRPGLVWLDFEGTSTFVSACVVEVGVEPGVATVLALPSSLLSVVVVVDSEAGCSILLSRGR